MIILRLKLLFIESKPIVPYVLLKCNVYIIGKYEYSCNFLRIAGQL